MKKLVLASTLFSFLYIFTSAQTDTVRIAVPDTLNAPIAAPSPVEPVLVPAMQTGIQKDHSSVYKFNKAVDIPIVAAGTIWAGFTMSKIYSKGPSTEEQILRLDRNDVNSFDRSAIYAYSDNLDNISYVPFYAAIPLPFAFFLTGEKMKSDFWHLSFLYWETMAVVGMFGLSATYFVDKYRPYAYTSETPMDKKISQNAKNSFYAGHVEIVAVSTFFISKVYSDYYPESNVKWLFYTGATAATAWMSYMRLYGGQHFISDIILGAGTGAAVGILVPQFHKVKDRSLGVLPYINGEARGLTLIYNFKNQKAILK